MTDRYDQDLLLGYLEGDLDEARRAQVEQMLAEDPQLASLMSGLAGDRATLRGMPAEQVPGDLGFDLVQGLERRMLLDAPEVQPAGPIPIQRGHDLAPPTGGVRWGRVVGLTGMAAALAMAAGLVVYFDAFNPLSRTALDMAAQESATPKAGENLDPQGPAGGVASGDNNNQLELAQPNAANETLAAAQEHDLASDALLAERARQAIRNGGAEGGVAPGGRGHTGSDERLTDLDTVAGPAVVAGPQVALTALAPEQALHIQSDDPVESRQQLLDWCVDNGVPIVEPQLTDADPAGGPTQIALLIEKEQLDKLLLAMNQDLNALHNNQRASVDPAETAYLQQAQPQALAEHTDSAIGDTASEQPPAVVELRVPEDLGDAVQTRLNVANTLLYSNRSELARTAQREAEVMRNQRQPDPGAINADLPDTDGPPAGLAIEEQEADTDDANLADGPGERNEAGDEAVEGQPRRGGIARDGGSRAGGGGQADAGSPAARGGRDDTAGENQSQEGPGDGTPDPQASPDAGPPPMREPGERPEGDDNTDTPPPADPSPAEASGAARQAEPEPERGNWLLAQVPLAPSTPIWTDPPAAQLVPIVIVRRVVDAEAAEAVTPPDTAEVTPAPADDE